MDTCEREDISTRRRSSRPRFVGVALLVVGLTALGACGSDDDGDEPESPTEAASFCEAVNVYAEKAEGGDHVAMSNALEGSTDELSDEDRRIVDAYISALTAASSNHSPSERRVEEDTEAGFRRVAKETCGEDALPAVDFSEDATTSTSEPEDTTPDEGTSTSDAEMGSDTD